MSKQSIEQRIASMLNSNEATAKEIEPCSRKPSRRSLPPTLRSSRPGKLPSTQFRCRMPIRRELRSRMPPSLPSACVLCSRSQHRN